MNYKLGDICYTYEGTKRRTVVIVQDGLGVDVDMTIARITSKNPRNMFDVQVEFWEEAGLRKPSVVRCSKISTIIPSQKMLLFGKMQDSDLKKVHEGIKLYFDKGFEPLIKNN